jgi:polyisoprenoid-binding protein YceI
MAAGVAAARGQAVADGALTHGTVSFDAHATLGAFTGVTSTLTGRIRGAPSLAGVTGWVESPAGSLTTHNGHRDRDMAKSLDIEHFPTMRFDLDTLSVGSASGDSIAVVAHGRLRLHGQVRPDSVPGWIWLHDGGGRFRGVVGLDVKDYGIGGLSKMFGAFKMNEHITVRVDASFGGSER